MDTTPPSSSWFRTTSEASVEPGTAVVVYEPQSKDFGNVAITYTAGGDSSLPPSKLLLSLRDEGDGWETTHPTTSETYKDTSIESLVRRAAAALRVTVVGLPSAQDTEDGDPRVAALIWGTRRILTPTLFATRLNVARIAIGDAHVILTTATGGAFAAGSNTGGQLGLGSRVGFVTFLCEIPPLFGTTVVAVAAGSSTSLWLTSSGDVYVSGYGAAGQLGAGDAMRSLRAPMKLPPESFESPAEAAKSGISSIFAGGDTCFAIASSGMAFAWGSNTHGQTGTGDSTSTKPNLFSPVAVDAVVKGGISHVAVGAEHSLFVTLSGELWAAGNAAFGRLGLGDKRASRGVPVRVRGALANKRVVYASAGAAHSLAVTDDGSVYAFGDNSKFQCGVLSRGPSRSKAPVSDRGTADLLSPHLSPAQDVPEFSDRQLNLPQLVSSAPGDVSSPAAPSWGGGHRIVSVAAGVSHSLALTENGTVFIWGRQRDTHQLAPLLASGVTAQVRKALQTEAEGGTAAMSPAGSVNDLDTRPRRQRLPEGVTSRIWRACRQSSSSTLRIPCALESFGADVPGAWVARSIIAGQGISVCLANINAPSQMPLSRAVLQVTSPGRLGQQASAAATVSLYSDTAAAVEAKQLSVILQSAPAMPAESSTAVPSPAVDDGFARIVDWASSHPQARLVIEAGGRGAVFVAANAGFSADTDADIVSAVAVQLTHTKLEMSASDSKPAKHELLSPAALSPHADNAAAEAAPVRTAMAVDPLASTVAQSTSHAEGGAAPLEGVESQSLAQQAGKTLNDGALASLVEAPPIINAASNAIATLPLTEAAQVIDASLSPPASANTASAAEITLTSTAVAAVATADTAPPSTLSTDYAAGASATTDTSSTGPTTSISFDVGPTTSTSLNAAGAAAATPSAGIDQGAGPTASHMALASSPGATATSDASVALLHTVSLLLAGPTLSALIANTPLSTPTANTIEVLDDDAQMASAPSAVAVVEDSALVEAPDDSTLPVPMAIAAAVEGIEEAASADQASEEALHPAVADTAAPRDTLLLASEAEAPSDTLLLASETEAATTAVVTSEPESHAPVPTHVADEAVHAPPASGGPVIEEVPKVTLAPSEFSSTAIDEEAVDGQLQLAIGDEGAAATRPVSRRAKAVKVQPSALSLRSEEESSGLPVVEGPADIASQPAARQRSGSGWKRFLDAVLCRGCSAAAE